MSQSGSGDAPSGEAGTRSRRKRRRRKRHSPPGIAAATGANAASGTPVSRHDNHGPREGGTAATGKRRKRGGRRGKARAGAATAAAGVAEAPKVAGGKFPESVGPGGAHAAAAHGKRKRKRKRGPRQQNNGHPQQRHMRAAVRPQSEARFDPPQRGEAPTEPAGSQAAVQSRRASYRMGARPVFAALDLGTNNCRLLIAAPEGPERFRVVDAYSRIVRLGEGLAATGQLQPQAMQRAIDALSICAAKLRQYQVAGQRLIATEACRAAENGSEFLDAVRRQTGLELEIVSRETEARLAAEGCGSLMDPSAGGAVLFDIGGGSTELVLVRRELGTRRRISDEIAGWVSLPVGVVNLSERHGGRNVGEETYRAMVLEVAAHIEEFAGRRELDDIWHPERTHLLGTSGTVTTLAGLHLELPRYDRRRVDGVWLTANEVRKVVGDLRAMDYETRSRNPCIGKERADLVLAGCAILEAILDAWPSPRLRVADRGLREGILNELMHASGVWHQGGSRHHRQREQGFQR